MAKKVLESATTDQEPLLMNTLAHIEVHFCLAIPSVTLLDSSLVPTVKHDTRKGGHKQNTLVDQFFLDTTGLINGVKVDVLYCARIVRISPKISSSSCANSSVSCTVK
jgi:hypothetical protein